MKKNKNIAGLLSMVPGLGHLYLGDWIKGSFLLVLTVVFIVEMIFVGWHTLDGFISLGDEAGTDNSLFLLIKGVMQVILTGIFLLVSALSIKDAVKTAAAWNSGRRKSVSLKKTWKSIKEQGFAYILTVPAYLVMAAAILFPVVVTICIAFTNYDFRHIPPASLLDWVGGKNFGSIFMLGSYRSTFFKVFSWTVIWTLVSTTLQVVLGIFLAVTCNQKFVRCKRIFGIIFLLPWAVPAFITIMSFSNIFNDSAGAINTQIIPLLNYLPFVNIAEIPWKTDPFWTKTALVMIQAWLGFPYIYVLTTSILQSIPEDLYEAARIDGAGGWKRFRHITMPYMMMIAAPTLITQYTGNFNNFSVIYLFNNGGPGSLGNNAGTTDILISWIYKMSMGGSPQYSVVAAVMLIISAFVIGVSLIVFQKTHAFRMEE